MIREPTRCERLLTRIAFHTLGAGVYKGFADALPVSSGAWVLDFGCGMGTVASHVAPRLPAGRLTCVDISERWMADCRKTLRKRANVSFLLGEIDRLSIPAASYDLAYCHFVLHDLTEPVLQRSLPALARLLKPGGLLIFREPLEDGETIRRIQALTEPCGLRRVRSSITDVPLMGTVLENTYEKTYWTVKGVENHV
ncbi:MAG TPA: class I SAM-dependent methyltransferase [Clostridia bacterium]|nr:class I SAM-dependent methyltransferase [Clostridia bacterium]